MSQTDIPQRGATSDNRGGILAGSLQQHGHAALASLGRIWRSRWSAIFTIMVIGIALALPAALHLLVKNANHLSERLGDQIDIAVYLSMGSTEEDANSLAASISNNSDIAGLRVVSADAGLVEFAQYSGLANAIAALDDNPLPHTVMVQPSQTGSTPERLPKLLQFLNQAPKVDEARLDRRWLDRLHAILDFSQRFAWLMGLLLAIAVIVVVGNTIRLEIGRRREEIEVVKLIGGTDVYIRRPFLYTGFWYGFFGSLIAASLLLFAMIALSGPAQQLITAYRSDYQITGIGIWDFCIVLFSGAFIAWFGSWLAVTWELWQIEPR